jgi:hypothetical protein
VTQYLKIVFNVSPEISSLEMPSMRASFYNPQYVAFMQTVNCVERAFSEEAA